MKAVVQRVKIAHVTVNSQIVGQIEGGLLVFLGVEHADTSRQVSWLAEKIAHLRIFADDQDKMNLSVKELGRDVLVISQFTLYGNCHGGRRPDFIQAAAPEVAQGLYNEFAEAMARLIGRPVQTGCFGAKMQVHLVNDGPVTLIIDTEKDKSKK